MLFRYFPQETRLRIIKTYLGPSGAWVVKDRITEHVPLLLGRAPKYAELQDRQVHLQVNGNGAPCDLLTDHVIAATGYRVDLHRLNFLSEQIRSSLRSIENAPLLSQTFESSVPGLYFVGLTSAHCFGPSMRFICGAAYTARRLSEHLTCVAAS
jgi:hypothetical protein